MQLEILAARFTLFAVILCAGCHEKESTEGSPGEYPSAPAGLAFSIPRGELMFFRPDDGEVLASYTLGNWPVTGASITVQGDRLVVTDGSHSRVGIFSLPDLRELTTKALGGVPVDMQISGNGSHAYVITHNSNLWDYLTATDVVDTLEIGAEPRRIALRPPLNLQAWIACPGDCTLYIIDLPHLQVEDTLFFGVRPSSVTFSPDGVFAYIALSGSAGTVQAVDASTRAAIDVRDAGTGPFELAMSEDGRFLAAADSGAGRTRVWNLLTGDRWDLPAGGRADRIRFSRDSDAFFVCVPERNYVLKISLSSGIPTVADTISVAPDLRELTLWEMTP
jgi:DNA-binding beta-propeller fold protein YncE